MNNYTITKERLTAETYIEFLTRTDLGSQYPQERFKERIERLVKNTPISLTARNNENKIIGVCFALTDFAYWLFITDLGIDRDYVHQGIGSALFKRAHQEAGGEKDIIVYTCANDNAIPFYKKLDMNFSSDILELNHVEWTEFTVQ